MIFEGYVDKEIFSCFVGAEKRGRDSMRGEMSKAQYHQKSRFVDLSSKRDRRCRNSSKSEDKKKWLQEHIGQCDIDMSFDELLEKLEDGGFVIEIRWSAQGPSTTIRFKHGYKPEVMKKVDKRGWPAVFRDILGI